MKTSRSTSTAVASAMLGGCALVIFISGCRVESPSPITPSESITVEPSSKDAAAKTETVTLEIFKPRDKTNADESKTLAADFTETFDVTSGTSLEEVMRRLDRPKIVITGSGVTAFVQSIDGVASDSSRGWTFTIDDKFSNVGIGSVKLAPPQRVRWRFTTFEEATE